MKDFNSDAANEDQNIIAIDDLMETSDSKVYIVQLQDKELLPIEAHDALYQGKNAKSILVAADDAELESYVASCGSDIEVLNLPSLPAARAKLISYWAKKIAKKNKNSLLP